MTHIHKKWPKILDDIGGKLYILLFHIKLHFEKASTFQSPDPILLLLSTAPNKPEYFKQGWEAW